MSNPVSIFRSWVPEWLIRFGLFAQILPPVMLFAISTSNVNAAAGFYGVSPNDIQYSLIILYGAVVSFLVLEGRFFSYLASREYFIWGTLLQLATCLVCYLTQSFFILLIMRYLQGMLLCVSIGITLTLMFSRLHQERSKEITYSVIYAILLSAPPISVLFTAPVIDTFNFNVIYKCALYSYIPGFMIMLLITTKVRLHKRIPLYQLDWPAFLLHAVTVCLIGYVLCYGQQYGWYDDRRIVYSTLLMITTLGLFIVRQIAARRPYINLNAFKNSKFVLAILLLFVFYIARGAFSITIGLMGNVLGRDPIHVGFLLLANISGIVASVVVSSRLLLAKRSLRLILISGFLLLLIFYYWMSTIFSGQIDAVDLIIPLMIQGMASGLLLTPIVLFIAAAAPPNSGTTGAAIGIFTRFTAFCGSIALINYSQLSGQADHINRFQNRTSVLDIAAVQRLALYKNALITRGMAPDQAANAATGLFSKAIAIQAQLKFAVDYYHFISWVLVISILIIALFPSSRPLRIFIKNEQPVPLPY